MLRRPVHLRGYTAVEVLIALTVLAIGAAGVIAMQRTAIRANLDARELDVANQIARTWAERLRRDAARWTLPSPSNPTGNNLQQTKYLREAPATGTGRWFLPGGELPPSQPGAEGESAAFDLLGRDLSQADAQHAIFCTHVRLTPLVPNELLRAEIRVVWRRGAGAALECSSATIDAMDPAVTPTAASTYRALHAVTAVRRNAAP